MSSIISNAKEDLCKKDIEQDADSIKHELEDMNMFVKKEKEEVERVNLTQLMERREEQLDPSIHISEKVSNKAELEYTVRYDVKFLKRKEQTEVVRLSPLRFRKKEEVLEHLMQNKIVDKPSISIKQP